MIFKFIKRYFYTIIKLNFSQILYRVKKNIFPSSYKIIRPQKFVKQIDKPIFNGISKINQNKILTLPNKFLFLNKEDEVHSFINNSNEKLWRYNLYYFNYLSQSKTNKDYKSKSIQLINMWIEEIKKGEPLEPYPTSLRIVNWIKWSLHEQYYDEQFISSLYSQAAYLKKNIEHDILGNHLIANSKALIFSGIYFYRSEGKKFLDKGKYILFKNIDKQILEDGGHYERSPMYHSIVLEDLLDIYYLAYNQKELFKSNEIDKLGFKISKMLSWLVFMTHSDGKISFFNDSALKISSSLEELLLYAKEINIRPVLKSENIFLKDSGYYVFSKNNINLKYNLGSPGPNEQPGHSHADTLSFEFSLGGHRTIVNSGTSTYEKNSLRAKQRSTSFHSTLEIENTNSSDVWSAFRLGRSAKVNNISYYTKKNVTKVVASHDGYYDLDKIIHTRDIEIHERKLVISDTLNLFKNNSKIRFFLSPFVLIDTSPLRIKTPDGSIIRVICDEKNMIIKDSKWYPEFGKEVSNKCIEILMHDKESLTIFEWDKI